MIYELAGGRKIDTARDLNFEERNFIQKMLIFRHLKVGLDDFQKRWRTPDSPVRPGPGGPESQSPAVQILLDLEEKIKRDNQS